MPDDVQVFFLACPQQLIIEAIQPRFFSTWQAVLGLLYLKGIQAPFLIPSPLLLLLFFSGIFGELCPHNTVKVGIRGSPPRQGGLGRAFGAFGFFVSLLNRFGGVRLLGALSV